MVFYYRKNPKSHWSRCFETVEPIGFTLLKTNIPVSIMLLGRQTGEYVGLRQDYGPSFWSLQTIARSDQNVIKWRTTRAKEFFAGWRRETRGGRRVWVRANARQLTLQVRDR
jgi:hypothetical protein